MHKRKPKAKAQAKPKQAYLPGIRVTDEAWMRGKRIKVLYAITGVRATIGAIFTELMMTHGAKLEEALSKKYDAMRAKVKANKKKTAA